MRNNPYLIKVIIPAFLLFLTGCIINIEDDDDDNDRRVKGTGELVTHEIDLPPFHDISNTGIMQLNISKGIEQKVSIRAQENIFEVLTFSVENGKLVIGTEDEVNISTNLGVFGDLVLTQDPENIHLTGTGDVTLSGKKQSSLNINIIGTGNIKAFDLELDDCNITSTGTGNCEVFVNEKLNVTITGIGNVYYKGQPEITQQIVGLGSVVDRN
ncbi:MAG: GIN domain-containing protein [Bacteroidota bacterium]